ncbi:MAG: GNAT family N-acetyltransferase [Thermoflexales bacterium]|nr:GNAT family N-acetyltransferase [Thermoflexales bacterium]
MFAASVVTLGDNLQQLVDEINQASWDAANEISEYDVAALSTYLERPDTVFVACHEVTDDGRTLLGMASARVELKPSGNERWLYVDEVDVCADQRRRGAGKAIMRKLIELAQEAGCKEVWLGAEQDNHAANALYQSLDPADVTHVIGYTYEILD